MRMDNNKGFTLVEAVVIMALIAAMIAFASPQVNSAFERYQFSNSIRSVVDAMIQARGTALHDGVQTSVTFTIAPNGRVNLISFVDDGDGLGIANNGIRDGNETILTDVLLYQTIRINNNQNTTFIRNANNECFTQFNSMGFAMGAPGGGVALYNGNIQFSVPVPSQVPTRTIQLSLSGTITCLPRI